MILAILVVCSVTLAVAFAAFGVADRVEKKLDATVRTYGGEPVRGNYKIKGEN